LKAAGRARDCKARFSKDDGIYVVEFKTAAGEAMAISIPRAEAAVIRLNNIASTERSPSLN
jgi:hypothetical protein